MLIGQAVPDMGTKTQVGVVGSPRAALDLQKATDVVLAMKARYAIRAVQAALDFDMVVLTGAADMPMVALLAVLEKEVVEYIDTACDQAVWVSFESRL
jgi:hypothetical protein